jgi:hypothetical protein
LALVLVHVLVRCLYRSQDILQSEAKDVTDCALFLPIK